MSCGTYLGRVGAAAAPPKKLTPAQIDARLREIATEWAKQQIDFVTAKISFHNAVGRWGRFNAESKRRGGFRAAMVKLAGRPVKKGSKAVQRERAAA